MMPSRDCTEAMAATAFRLQSHSGCMVEELLASPHRKAPYLCFRLLLDDSEELVAQLSNPDMDHVLDPWSQSFVDAFRGRLQSDEA